MKNIFEDTKKLEIYDWLMEDEEIHAWDEIVHRIEETFNNGMAAHWKIGADLFPCSYTPKPDSLISIDSFVVFSIYPKMTGNQNYLEMKEVVKGAYEHPECVGYSSITELFYQQSFATLPDFNEVIRLMKQTNVPYNAVTVLNRNTKFKTKIEAKMVERFISGQIAVVLGRSSGIRLPVVKDTEAAIELISSDDNWNHLGNPIEV